MAEGSLRELLAQLHEQLGASGREVDADSRRLLVTLMQDIERTLEAPARTGKEPSATAARHSPRLESLAVRFEAGHPALAEALRELIDALVKAGI